MTRKWLKRIFVALALLVVIGVSAIYWLQSFATPTVREHVDNPLFTIGDATYAQALGQGKNIVKFGPLPLGLYPGGMAFDNAEEAAAYLDKLNPPNPNWNVYVLSGDYQLDTYENAGQRYTDKSLLVLAQADLQTAPQTQQR